MPGITVHVDLRHHTFPTLEQYEAATARRGVAGEPDPRGKRLAAVDAKLQQVIATIELFGQPGFKTVDPEWARHAQVVAFARRLSELSAACQTYIDNHNEGALAMVYSMFSSHQRNHRTVALEGLKESTDSLHRAVVAALRLYDQLTQTSSIGLAGAPRIEVVLPTGS